jgi:hypothetical protein
MSRKTPFALSIALAMVCCALSGTSSASDWIRIDVASEPFTDRNGVQRTPGCSGGPELVATPGGPVPIIADTDFSFFFRVGNTDELAIFWDGGGACWDALTCVGSALSGSPLYNLTVDETATDLDAAPGLGDLLNPANPIRDYTQVFIPYCTGDLHTGARDTTYFYPAADGSTIPWTIHHRGYDNVVAVLEWLTDYYQNDVGRAPARVFLGGASAGGYGVLYGYPAVAKRLPASTRTRVMVDAANGVINQDFYDRALATDGVWGIWDNMAPELAQAFSSRPDALTIEIFKSLGWNYPHTRFGQYTTAFDAVQILYYNVARNLNSPELWFDPLQIVLSGADFTFRARTYMLLTALQTFNYRAYLAKGSDHTVIADNKFYTEDSAQGVYLSDWLDDMINRFWPWGGDWRNVSCAPDCLP